MTSRRKCSKCGRFGHYAKTCNRAPLTANASPNQIDTSQALGASTLEVTQPDKPTGESSPTSIGEAVGASEFAQELDGAGQGESGEVYQGEVVTESESKPATPTVPAGPTPAEVGFKKSVETVLTIWEIGLNRAAKAEIAPPVEIKDLVAQAWTDCAKQLGWLEHANDPRVAVVLAVGLTGGTYGVATYEVYMASKAKKAGRKSV